MVVESKLTQTVLNTKAPSRMTSIMGLECSAGPISFMKVSTKQVSDTEDLLTT